MTRPARPTRRADPTVAVATPSPQNELYTPEEALRDALSGPWQYVGTGSWPGNNRMVACAFRNARVLIVDAYCSITETQAFRVDIYSPRRGRVRIYAEANGPVSARKRSEYFTFTIESEPAAAASARVPPLSLAMSFEQLRTYEEQRYAAYLPGCFGGEERHTKRSGCLGALESKASSWAHQSRAFLMEPNADWYRVVRDMRALASQHGRQPQ